MKILLLYPPLSFLHEEECFVHTSPPLGLAYIGAILEGAGYDVKAMDCGIENWGKKAWETDHYHVGLSWQELKTRIQKEKPDIIGLSCLFSSQFENAAKTAGLVKQVDPAIKVVAGGAHPSCAPSEAMKDKNLDFIAIGEGENTMLSIVQSLEGGSPLSHVDGLAYRDNGAVKINPKKSFITNLNSLPFPA